MTGSNSDVFAGGAIVYTAAVAAGTKGVYIEYGNQNFFYGLDVENFSVGYEIDATDNALIGARTEGNTTGIVTSAAGTFLKVIGGSHGDGITDNSGSISVLSTNTDVGLENHLTGFLFWIPILLFLAILV